LSLACKILYKKKESTKMQFLNCHELKALIHVQSTVLWSGKEHSTYSARNVETLEQRHW
jgi:hypothetical protein